MIEIRGYRPADLPAVISVFIRAIRVTAARDYSQGQIEAWAQADPAIWAVRRADRPTWVALIGGRIVGFSDLEPDGHLDMMFVCPDHGGRGVATALLRQVEQAAAQRTLALIFTQASLTARPFFERRGFVVLQAQEAMIRGERLRNVRMHKRLPPHDGPPPD